MVKITSARIDERGKASGGRAGDQTGREVSTQGWYLHPKGWVVLRPIDLTAAALIADTMQALDADNRVGYDQSQRNTLWNEVKAAGFDPAAIARPVETDCSAAVRVCIARAGIVVSDFTTATQAARLMATGKFTKLTAAKYTRKPDYLRRGDILVTRTQGHTVVVTTDGPGAEYPLGGRMLNIGCSGQDVEDLQGYLKALGYGKLLGAAGMDGQYGPRTAAAVKAFQEGKGLRADGIAGITCIEAIIAAANGNDVPADGSGPEAQPSDNTDALGRRMLREGDSGPDVAELQEGLKRLSGYNLGGTGDNHDGVDGYYGPLTMSAVTLFQVKSGLTGNGIFDADAFRAFTAALAALETGGAEDDEDETIYPSTGYIPDISANQATFRADEIARKCPFVVLRARVSGKTDSTYKDRAAALHALGHPHWDYDYIKTTSIGDATAQADAMYTLCQPYKPIGYFLDVETLADGVSYTESREHIRAYVARLRERAATDGITIKIGEYMGTSRHDAHYKDLDGIFDTHWPAAWGANDGYLSKLPTYGDLHQYTSRFDAKTADFGCPGARDANRLTGRKPLSFFTGRAHDGTGYAGVAKVIGQTVNIRAAASASSKRLATVRSGAIFERRAGDVNGWVAINYRGQQAYVSAQYVALIVG